jgi:hypothetical protein
MTDGNDTPHGPASSPEPQRVVRDGPLGTKTGKKTHTGRVLICVTSCRLKLLDPDNLCPKYFIDSLRYAGIIHDDDADSIELSLKQERVATPEEERTEIAVYPL